MGWKWTTDHQLNKNLCLSAIRCGLIWLVFEPDMHCAVISRKRINYFLMIFTLSSLICFVLCKNLNFIWHSVIMYKLKSKLNPEKRQFWWRFFVHALVAGIKYRKRNVSLFLLSLVKWKNENNQFLIELCHELDLVRLIVLIFRSLLSVLMLTTNFKQVW